MAGVYHWIPTHDVAGMLIIGSTLGGWILMGVTKFPFGKPWVKGLLMLLYPLFMMLANLVLMVALYGIPGL